MELAGINQALKDGCRVHAFRSGSGLRVIRIEHNEELKGYGEQPQVEGALSDADEDFLAGGRPYEEVYGALKPHYLTGGSTSTSPLDSWLLQGRTFDAWQDGENVVFQLKGVTEVKIPREILDEVLRTGKPATWEHRGYTYRTAKFPAGEPCTSTEVIQNPNESENNTDAWMYHITKTGRGADFCQAMENALRAEEVEVD